MHELYWYWKMGASSPANVTCAYQTWDKVFYKRVVSEIRLMLNGLKNEQNGLKMTRKFKKGQTYPKKSV